MERFARRSVVLFLAACVLSWWIPSTTLAWTPSLNLSNDVQSSQAPDVAVAPNGTIHAVWTDITTHRMLYSSRAVGGSWSTPEVVATYADITAFMDGDIVVAVGPDGTVHILYADDTSGSSELFHRSKPLGGAWSSPVNITQAPGHRSEFPSLAVSPDGTLHASWIETQPRDTFYASKTPDGSWVTPVDISNNTTTEYPTRLGVGPDNSVHVVSAQEDGGPGLQNIYYYTKPAGGTFSAGENLTGTANVGRGLGTVLVTGDGTVHVVYSEGSTGEIMYMNKPVCGSWSTPVNLSNNAGSSFAPALGSDGCGNLHLVWADNDGGPQKILYASKVPGGSWTTGLDITGGAMSANAPSIAVAAPRDTTTGTVEVVYANAPSGNPDVYFTEVSITGCTPPTTTAVRDRPAPDDGLGQSFPNPFNPETSIPILMTHSGHVRVDVYSVDGARVRRLIDEDRGAGTFSVRWNGRDDRGVRLASGVYFYSLTIDGRVVAAKKAVLLK